MYTSMLVFSGTFFNTLQFTEKYHNHLFKKTTNPKLFITAISWLGMGLHRLINTLGFKPIHAVLFHFS